MTAPAGSVPARRYRGGRRWPRWPCAAHLQVVQIFGVEVGCHRLDELPVDEDVHGVLIDLHVRSLPGSFGAHADPLNRGDHGE
jgi:hypothetical protein